MKIAPLFIATLISNVGLSAPLHSSESKLTPQFQIVLETTIPKAQDLSIELEEIVSELKDGAKENKRNNYTILLSKIQETLTNEEYTPEPDHALRLLQIERIFLELLEQQEELSERFIEQLKKEELESDENTEPENFKKNLQEGSEPFEIGFTPEAPVQVSKNENRGAERTNSFNGPAEISATSTVSESTVTPAPISSRRTTTLTTTTTISGGVPQGGSNQASGPKIIARKGASASKCLTNSDEFFSAPSATYVKTTGPIRRSKFGSDKPREYAYTPTERVQGVETAGVETIPYAPLPKEPAKREISSPIAQAVVAAEKEPSYEAPLRLEASEFSEEPANRGPQYASTATWLNGFISDYQEEKRESLRKGQVADPFGPAFVENETIGPYRPVAENKKPEVMDTQLAKEIIPADPTKKESGLQRMMSFLDERNG